MASKYWIKLYHEILDDHKMGMLPDHLYRRVIEIFLLAGEKDEGGLLPSIEAMAWRLRTTPDDLIKDLKELSKNNIVTQQKGNWIVTKFAERQAPMDKAEYMRRKREQDKREEYYTGSVTSGNDTVTVDKQNGKTDTDTDKITDKKRKEEDIESTSDIVSSSSDPPAPAVYNEDGELAPLEDRIIEIFCDRVGLYGEDRPYEHNASQRKWYADWLKDAAKLADMKASSLELEEAIALLKTNGYSCKRPGAVIDTIKNIRADIEKFEAGHKNKIRRYKLSKVFNESTRRNEYYPEDYWQENKKEKVQ